MGRKKKNIVETVQNEFPEFASEVLGLSADQLNNRLAQLAKAAEENEDAKERDQELSDAQALASELSLTYKDVKKAVRMKSKFIIQLLKDKGADA